MSDPRNISVVIPHAGSLFHLERQLQALSQQSALPREVVVSCNRPEAFSSALAHFALVPDYPYDLKLIDSSSTPGPSAARNVGWKAASSSLIFFCDDDDLADDRWVEGLSAALEHTDIAVGALDLRLLNSNTHKHANPPAHAPTKFGHLPYGPTCNLATKQSVLTKVGGFDESISCAEDIDFCWRAQYLGYKLSYAPKAIMHYQLRQNIRAAYRQGYSYGLHDGWLLQHHRSKGARRTLTASLRQLATIPFASVGLISGRNTASDLAQKFGDLIGRIISSVKHRIWVV